MLDTFVWLLATSLYFCDVNCYDGDDGDQKYSADAVGWLACDLTAQDVCG